MCYKKTAIEKALHANECVRWIEAFIANLGHPLWGSQSMQELAPGMRNVLPFLIRDAKSCIDCEPHKGWPRFAMNASIHLTHSFACSAFSMAVFYNTRFQNHQNLKLIFFERMHKSEKIKDICASKIIPIKLYTHLLCTTKIWLSFMNVVKRY